MKKDQFYQLMRHIPNPNSPEGAAQVRELLLEQGIDPNTVHQRIEMSARFVDAHQDISNPGDVIPPHSHSFHEMVYCITGGVDYLIGTERLHLHKGDILSIPMGVTHAPLIPENLSEPYRRYVLWLSPEFSQFIASMFLGDPSVPALQQYFIRTADTNREYLVQYFRRCVQECEQRQYRWEAAAFGIATELAVQLARLWHMDQPDLAEKPDLLDQIVNFVEGHLAERITVADVAARFWVSQSTISQLFRKKMGISFYRYVTQRRLLESKVLIKTGVPMDQVSIAVGFQDYSTFYRAFKSEFGLSPAQFRKQQ